MKLVIIIILLITISSCQQEKIDSNGSIVNRIVQACEEERENAQYKEWYRELLVELREPKIDSNHITYIFQLRLPYNKEYRFRIQEKSDSSFTLLSKAYGSATLPHELPDSIPYRTLSGSWARLVESEQVFTRQELDTFKTILEGSFYWSWDDPYKMDYGFSDGPTWNLESIDYLPRDTAQKPRLQYHSNYVYEPVYSSYTVACIYLMQRSKLLKRLPYLKAYTDYYMKHKGIHY